MQNTYNSPNFSGNSQNEKTGNDTFQRMAKFGANIADAFGCYIFLPPSQLFGTSEHSSSNEHIVLAGVHSLSNDVIRNCTLEVGHGLIGWVAKHKRSIHVSPFERDSRTLGLYQSDQSLKSFIGIPVFLEGSENQEIAGVIACDSKKSFAFSKLQGKLLEDLACEVSSHLRLNSKISHSQKQKNSWQEFINMTSRLSETIGKESIDILRVRVENYPELEKALGSGRAFALCEQVHRLIEQSIPAQFPYIRFSNGDLIIAIDNMMLSFIENKITALTEHCACSASALNNQKKTAVRFSYHKQSANTRTNRGLTIEELVQMTSETDAYNLTSRVNSNKNLGLVYEYKRA